ncbi:MAG: hypothetical protein HY474_02130 [Candidatus Sungbacteria bacterium]|uniref:Uncharacterized protein n=1 Tax=Candidatus Sungiibacteriota bacterium TaxID=2750080 RepID=A0A932YVV5_9BACT|nr:hypothetical protein [Candidatus Sungbacteria bacterium]
MSTITGAELWFREHPWTSTAELTQLFCNRGITATPRLGERGSLHSKGYAIGQRTIAKLFGSDGRTEILAVDVEVIGLAFCRLRDVTVECLARCEPACRDTKRVGEILGYFAERPIPPEEMVTVVLFAYRSDLRIAEGC